MQAREGKAQTLALLAALPRPALDAAAVLLGSIALAVSAKIELPFRPVTMTLETLAVLAFAARVAYLARLIGGARQP